VLLTEFSSAPVKTACITQAVLFSGDNKLKGIARPLA
jgi:hypothetical protein